MYQGNSGNCPKQWMIYFEENNRCFMHLLDAIVFRFHDMGYGGKFWFTGLVWVQIIFYISHGKIAPKLKDSPIYDHSRKHKRLKNVQNKQIRDFLHRRFGGVLVTHFGGVLPSLFRGGLVSLFVFILLYVVFAPILVTLLALIIWTFFLRTKISS